LTSATLDFGDGSSVNVGTLSASTNVPHAYTQAGTYTARLTATDANGENAESSQVVQVNAAASVSLQLTKSGLTVTGTVTLSGATATQFAWNFEGGTNPNYVNTSSEQTHTYTAMGTKTVSVTVTLSDGSTRTVSRTIDVP
jgi:PKD repeat protein